MESVFVPQPPRAQPAGQYGAPPPGQYGMAAPGAPPPMPGAGMAPPPAFQQAWYSMYYTMMQPHELMGGCARGVHTPSSPAQRPAVRTRRIFPSLPT